MSTFSIAIRTVPRTPDYFRATLHRLIDSGTLQHPSLLGLHVSNRPDLTPNENGARALRLAAQDSPRWIIFLEDDVDMIDDFLGSVDRWLDNRAQATIHAFPLSCFYPLELARCVEAGDDYWDYPLDLYYGSQGFAIRLLDALSFAHWVERLPNDYPRRDVSFDLKLAHWHRMREPNFPFMRTPSVPFLDHTGEFSAIGPPGSWERVGRVTDFPGHEWSYRP